MAKNEVVKAEENTAVAVAPALQVEVSSEDMMVPFLKVVQSLSEEVVPGKDKYNADVRPGDLYDGVTKTIFKNSQAVICGLRKYYAEWTPEVRGKLVGKHPITSPVVANALKIEKTSDKGNSYFTLQTAGGNDLIETYGVVMIVKNEDGLIIPAVLTLSKTSFIVGKQLSTLLTIHQAKGVPLFNLGTSSSSNTKGSWFKPSFTFAGYETDESVLAMAASMNGVVDNILFNNLNTEDGPGMTDAANDLL